MMITLGSFMKRQRAVSPINLPARGDFLWCQYELVDLDCPGHV